ncbi:hypothetical protein EON63_21695 [archaeon]|nr:MAG: hypothetical protein EON63_21695 [archaeon]
MSLISERKVISKTVDDYEGRKSTSLTTAGRIAEFLGMVYGIRCVIYGIWWFALTNPSSFRCGDGSGQGSELQPHYLQISSRGPSH